MNWKERYTLAMMDTFGDPNLILERGEGVKVWDDAGNEYLDLLGGIAVNALGYAHPVMIEAITTQAEKFAHVSNYFGTKPQIELAERLHDCLSAEGYIGSAARIFFSNSGTEANEAALKIARLHKPGGKILSLTNGFHGRTLGSLSATYKPAIREPFEPLPGNVEFIEPTQEAVEAAFDENVAAIFLETIQGEAGVMPVPVDLMRRARDLADRFNALVVVDEVQTGMGRTGRWFAHSQAIKADVITLAKGLGGGVPIGATIGIDRAGQILTPGMHGSTFGGNPLATATALAVVNEIEKLLPNVARTGFWLTTQLQDMGYTVRGAGLLLGIEVPDAPAAAEFLLERGIIVNVPNPTTLRIAPPLIIAEADLAPFVAAMEELKEK